MFTQLKTSKNANTGVLSVFFMLQVSQPSSREGKNHPQGGMGSYMLQSQKQNLEPNFPTRSLSLSLTAASSSLSRTAQGKEDSFIRE